MYAAAAPNFEPTDPPPDRRLAAWTGAGVAIACAGLLLAHWRWSLPLGRAVAGPPIGDVGLAIQVAALVAGIVAVHAAPRALARPILATEGAVCVLAWGAPGLAFLAVLVAWWGLLELRWLGRARFALAAALLVGVNACAWAGRELAGAALVFSVAFTARLVVYAYDRWQRDDEPAPLLDYLVFILLAPLVVVPPYFVVIPLFGRFSSRIRPGLDAARLRTIARHLALAAVFAAARAAFERAGGHGALVQPAAMYAKLLGNLLDLAVIGHAAMGLLLLHGVTERPPIDRPLLATRFTEFWQRFATHLKDAQVFLFYTPALLRLRRANRYVAIALATAWTMLVGNTLLHAAITYCFAREPWAQLGWALAANALMAAVLTVELCRQERWRRRGGAPPRTWWRVAAGWGVTMTAAASAAWL